MSDISDRDRIDALARRVDKLDGDLAQLDADVTELLRVLGDRYRSLELAINALKTARTARQRRGGERG